MMAEKDSFSSLDIGKSIPIHMGDDSTIISEGQGTVDLENGFFSNVLYVSSLAENILSVYYMKHIGIPKRVSFIPNDVEITKIASGKLIAKGLANHRANIRGNLGSKMGLIRKRANNKFCDLEFKNQ